MPALRALLLLLLLAAPLSAQLPPDARWLGFETEHFRVTYPDGLEEVARRAAAHAEEAYAVLSAELLAPPRGRIELVVSDNVDTANGFATPIPTNRVVVFTHPPVSDPGLAFFDDWLQLVVLHELVHIFHLDTAEGVWSGLRAVFGRNPLFFPELLTPGWMIEGVATYYESELTRGGRVRGSMHEMVLRTAILHDRFFSLDRATADPLRWPGGSTRYTYGSMFIDHLARTYGPGRLGELITVHGGSLVPYRLQAAAREAFGVSFSRAWREWEDSLRTRFRAQADSLRALGLTEPELLTVGGRSSFYPRYSPDGAAIAYASATSRDEPALRLIHEDGSISRLAVRTVGGPAAWARDGSGLITSLLDYVDQYRIFSDLQWVSRAGDAERLTRAARVWEPDLHPDGDRAVVVASAPGTNVLAIHEIGTGRTTPLIPASPDVHWSLPRWSPDGERIAVARWERGVYDLLVLDARGDLLRRVTADRALDMAPAWSPDGRYLVFASDRTGIPNLFAFELESGRLFQVTNLLTGAAHPDVSPDGSWIVFSLYGPDGFDIARIPFDPAGWRPAPAPRPELAAEAAPTEQPAPAGGPARRYSPFPSVLPSAWTVLADAGTTLGFAAGASAFGQDVVQRHQWSVEAMVYPSAVRFDGGAGYTYRGLGNPVLRAAVTQRWGVRTEAGQVVLNGDTVRSAVLRRDRAVEGAARWVRRRWRSTGWMEAGGRVNELDLVWDRPDAAPGVNLVDYPIDLSTRLSAGFSTARAYGISLGPQDGVSVGGTVSAHKFAAPIAGEERARGYLRTVGRTSAFLPLALPGFARHVLAVRLAAGAETGSRSPGFGVGGAGGDEPPIPVEVGFLGGSNTFPVRGYPTGAQQGDRALSAAAEYRFPLALVERGIGLLPLALGRVWGDVFADAGAAWCRGAAGLCRAPGSAAPTDIDPLYSVGAELVLHLRAGYLADLPIRLGAAVPLREVGGARGPSAYLRVGRSF